MTLPSDDTPDREAESGSPPAKKEGPPQDASAEVVRAPVSAPASAIPSLPGVDPVWSFVEEIKVRVSDLAARESELQRREQELAEQRRHLEQRALEAAQKAAEPQRRERELRVKDLEARAAQLDERRRGLDEFERSLADQQRRQDEQRAVIEETLNALADREAADKQRRAEVRRRLAEKLDLIRQRKNEFIEKVRIVRSELKQRQLALARDRRALDGQIVAMEGRHETLAQRADALEQRARAVETRAENAELRRKELEATAAKLDERAESLVRQEADLATRRQQVNAEETELDRHRVELDRRAGELAQRAEALETTATELAERAETLEAQQAEQADSRRELESRESELRDQDRGLQTRAQQLDAWEHELEKRRAEYDTEAEALRARAAEVERSRAVVGVRAAELETVSAQLDELARTLKSREQDLRVRQAELDQDRRLVSEAQEALAQQLEEVGARERTLEEQQATLAVRARQLDERETALSEQTAAVGARREESAQREAEIEARRASVDTLYQQATEAWQRARQRQQEVTALKQRLEAREAELRREGLQTEVDREQIERDRAALIAEREKLAESQAEVERERDRVCAAAEQHVEPAAATSAVPSIPPARLRRRGLVLCGAAGAAAAFIWLAGEQPRYRGFAEIRIASARGSAAQIVNTHAGWLMSDALVECWQGPPGVEAWIAARTDRRVATRSLPDSRAVRLTLDTADKILAETLLPAAARTYIAYVDNLPLERFRSPRLLEWTAALENELAELRNHQQAIRARLTEVPASSARDEAQAAFENALDESRHVVARLGERREELVALRSQELPRGEVTAEAYQQALADDALYQEDFKELRSEVRAYRIELAVSMVLLVDPLRELRKSVQALAATMVEQRDLQPPPAVRTLLERCLAEVDDFNRFLAEFSQTWDGRRETIERLKVSEQVVELLDQQQQAADAAGRLVQEARRVLDEVKTRIDGLSEKGDAGTRAIVVAAVLRGDLSRLTEQVDALAEAVGATDLSVNFRLDAHDRQLRSLRTRLRDRERLIRQTLQAEADRAARAEHDEQERQLRESISALDQQRQELMDTLVAQLERLRELGEQYQEQGDLSAGLRAEEAIIARLEEHFAEFGTEQPQPQRERVELADSGSEQIAGVNRLRNATLAGAGTFAATALLFLLMFVQRRPRSLSAPKLTNEEATGDEREHARRKEQPQ